MSGPLLEWSCTGRPYPGQAVSGDRALVNLNGCAALCAVVDGLGHGAAAALAADRAIEAIGSAATAGSDLVERCHAALGDTRGAAIGIASVDGASAALTWFGVGNVEGRILRSGSRRRGPLGLLLAPGIVGHKLPRLRPTILRVRRGYVLLIATDGVDPAFADSLSASGSCAAIAARVLEEHARPADDALVLVARYLGAGP